MIRAILRAQWLSLRIFHRGAGRRAAIFSLVLALAWYAFWGAVAVAIYGVTSEPELAPMVAHWLGRGLLLIFLYWQLAPLLTASFGASLDLRKLLIYPVPRGNLFTVEVLLRITAAGEMLLVLAGGVLGLFRNPVFGGWAAAPRLLGASLLFLASNLLLAAGLRNLIERVLEHRRVREVLVLGMVILVALPRLLISMGVRPEGMERLLGPAEGGWWPWAAAAAVLAGRDAAANLALLAGWAAAAWLFGRWQFARSLRFDAQAARASAAGNRPRAGGLAERLYRLPSVLLPDPLGAIVEKELRSLSRTPRFRTVFIMGFTFGLVVWLPLIVGRSGGRNPVVAEHFLVVVSLYAFAMLGQVSYWNALGFDRSAAQVWFAMPVPISRALAGKNLAAALFILVEVAAVTAACLALRVPIPPLRILEAFLVTPVAALYLLSVGNLSSVHFPKPIDPERASQGGGANRMQGLLFLVYPLALLPIALAYLARYGLDSELAFYLVLAFAAAFGVAVYWVAMESACDTARARRETILAELSRTAGPVMAQ